MAPTTPTPTETPTAAPVRSCSVAAAAADPRLAHFEGTVVDAATGEVLFDRGGSTPAAHGAASSRPLTSAAALAVLGPDHRLTTRVTGDVGSGAIALVGGGDARSAPSPPAAACTPARRRSPTSPRQVKTRLGDAPVSRITLDADLLGQADEWDPSWKRSEQTIGYHAR